MHDPGAETPKAIYPTTTHAIDPMTAQAIDPMTIHAIDPTTIHATDANDNTGHRPFRHHLLYFALQNEL